MAVQNLPCGTCDIIGCVANRMIMTKTVWWVVQLKLHFASMAMFAFPVRFYRPIIIYTDQYYELQSTGSCNYPGRRIGLYKNNFQKSRLYC